MLNDDTKKQAKTSKKNNEVDKEILQLKEQIASLEADVLYAKAEAENVRKRCLDEIDKARKFAVERLSQEILLIKDSLDAALIIEKATLEYYKNGMELTKKQLVSIFEKFGIEEMNPVDETFDPNYHQAMTMIETDDEPNKVLSVMQKGYKLNDRVLRPALVTVSKQK